MQACSWPLIFVPLNLRSGLKYRRLSRHIFSASDKLWVCQHLLVSCSDLDTDLMPAVRIFCGLYNIKLQVIIDWLKLYSDGGNLNNPTMCPIDEEGVNSIHQVINVGCRIDEPFELYLVRLNSIIRNELLMTNSRKR